MRLLTSDGNGGFSLTEDFMKNPPQYAILSHTWQTEGDEVTYKDMIEDTAKAKLGYAKIRFCGEQAARDGLQYFWVDSCCIDKSNSAELNEAINSMFRWYENAHKCYVYLSDVPAPGIDEDAEYYQQAWKTCFRKSRWFTRGWTLQEMLAPAKLEFYSRNSEPLGSKRSLEWSLHEITGIPIRALHGQHLRYFSVEERLSWAEARETTREEDKYYSLLGIFGVSIPLIYGEGRRNAFRRLRDEINRGSTSLPQSDIVEETLRPGTRNNISNLQLSDFQSEKEVGVTSHFNTALEQKFSEHRAGDMRKEKISRDLNSQQYWFLLLPKIRWASLIILVLLSSVIIATYTLKVGNTPLELDILQQIPDPTWPVFAVIGRRGSTRLTFITSLGGQFVYASDSIVTAGSSGLSTVQIMWYRAMVDGSPVYIMDTSGIGHENLDDKRILQMIWYDLRSHAIMKDRLLTGIIFLHDVHQTTIGHALAEDTMDALQNLLGHNDFYRLALVITDPMHSLLIDKYGQRANDIRDEVRAYFDSEDAWKHLTDAGAEVIHHDGTLLSATSIINQLLANRDKKPWDKPRREPQSFDGLPNIDATLTIPNSTAGSTTTTTDVPLTTTSLKPANTSNSPKRNWIARMMEHSAVATVAYGCFLAFVFIVFFSIDYARPLGYSRQFTPIALSVMALWLLFDLFSTAGNRSSSAVFCFCGTLVKSFTLKLYLHNGPQSSAVIASLLCVLFSCGAVYTLYDWIYNT